MDLLSEIETLKADALAANGLLSEAQASVAGFQSQLAAKDAELSAKATELDAVKAQLALDAQALQDKEAELANALAEVAALKTSQKSAAEIAVEQMAKVGAKPMAAPMESADDSKVTTRDEAMALWSTADGAKAKAAVWAEHKALLTGK